MIRIIDVHKTFGSVQAVAGVSLCAKDGEITGLLGPNGAGKTTTLRILSSLITPDSGEAWVDDINVHAQPEKALARLGMLPDSRGLYPRLTAREHLAYFGRLHGMAEAEIEKRANQLVELLDMKSIVDRRVEGFSQGERTKVAIGRAIIHSPQNVVLDEATNGLDVMSARALRSVVANLAKSGACVLFSSHIMAEVASLCDRIVIFSKGRVAIADTPENILRQSGQPTLEDAFVQIVAGDVSEAEAAP